MLTEADAKTKWCPFALAPNNGERPVAINRNNREADVDCACLASGCMAWRTAPKGNKRIFVTFEDKPEEEWNWDPTNHKGYEGYKVRVVEPDAMGFCGLAGKDPA